MQGRKRAGYGPLRALALAFEIDDSALELELAMNRSSSGRKKRPVWVRAIFFGSGRIQMDSHQHILVEKFAVVAGMAFVIVGVFGTNGSFAPESAKVPMLLCASLLFLSAYLMSLIVRIGSRYSVWPWVDPDISAS